MNEKTDQQKPAYTVEIVEGPRHAISDRRMQRGLGIALSRLERSILNSQAMADLIATLDFEPLNHEDWHPIIVMAIQGLHRDEPLVLHPRDQS